MTEPIIRRLAAPALAPIAFAFGRMGVGPVALAGIGLLSGIGASASLAMHERLLGLVLILLSRALFAVGDGSSRMSPAADALRPVLAVVSLAAGAFGFALGDMSHALAACFLVVGILAEHAAVRACVAFMREAGSSSRREVRSETFDEVFGLMATAGLGIACISPDWFGIAAYVIGVLGFVVAGHGVAALVGVRAS